VYSIGVNGTIVELGLGLGDGEASAKKGAGRGQLLEHLEFTMPLRRNYFIPKVLNDPARNWY
jgi:hypothetical protein